MPRPPHSIIATLISLASAAGETLIPELVGNQPPAPQPLSQSPSQLPQTHYSHSIAETPLDAGIILDLEGNNSGQGRQGPAPVELGV